MFARLWSAAMPDYPSVPAFSIMKKLSPQDNAIRLTRRHL